MEQTARDQLVAASLVASPALAASVLDARTRGLTVIMSSDETAEPDQLAAFRLVLAAVAADASPGSVVRAKCRPRGSTLGPVVVLGVEPTASDLTRWRDTNQAAAYGVHLEISPDEDSVLVEFVATRADRRT